MKLKKLWIPMLILTVIGGSIKICDTVFNVYGDGFIFNSMVCNWIFAVSAAILLIIGWILSIRISFLCNHDRQRNYIPAFRKPEFDTMHSCNSRRKCTSL